jgi:polygalacturonase
MLLRLADMLVLWSLAFLVSACGSPFRPDPWAEADSIAAHFPLPRIPARDFVVTDFGAIGDGTTDCSEAFRRAIDTCSSLGGGRVLVPAGTYLSGPIRLRSNVNLHLSDRAVIRFERDTKKYLPAVFTRFEGVELMNYSPLIRAMDDSNIAITGNGTLDGRADNEHWWPWKGAPEYGWREGMPKQDEARARLFDMAEHNIPPEERIFGEGSYLRPSFVEPYNCRTVLISGITVINSPMWEIHPVLCRNVTIEDVHIDSHGPNNDGCNPESSTDVIIRNCTFSTGDDCIAIKSGRNADGRRINIPSENIVIRGCRFADGHGGITLGSEISGGVRKVFAEDCDLGSPILFSALRIKSNAVRGGTLEHIFLRDIRVGHVNRAVVDVDLSYEEGHNGRFLPVIRDVSIERMTVNSCTSAFHLVGYDDAPLRDFTLKDCTFDSVKEQPVVDHIIGLHITNVKLNGKEFTQ